jgi:hypothetical protein
LDSWAFRGQNDHSWPLQPSLEWDLADNIRREAEQHLFSAFRKRAHHFAAVHMEEDYLGWLALMRHHGAPSRLLDWTLSPYVAAYFALYEGFKKQSVDLHCAVWAIDIKWLNEHAWRVLARGSSSQSFSPPGLL